MKISSCLLAKSHLVFHWCLYDKLNCLYFQGHEHCEYGVEKECSVLPVKMLMAWSRLYSGSKGKASDVMFTFYHILVVLWLVLYLNFPSFSYFLDHLVA